MLNKSTSNYDALDEMVLGEFAGAPQAPSGPAPNPPVANPGFQPTLVAEEVLDAPQVLAKPRGGFGSRLAAAVLHRKQGEPLDARVSDEQQRAPDIRRTPRAPLKGEPASAPARAPAPVSPPTPATAKRKPPEAPQSRTQSEPVHRPPTSAPKDGVLAVPRRKLTARARPALKVAALAATLVGVGWAGFSAGQNSIAHTSSVAVDPQPAINTAPSFGLTTPITVAAPVPAAASSVPADAASGSVLAPEAVLAAASANLPPVASLPPAIDEHKVDQHQPAARGATPVPAAPAPAPAPAGASSVQAGAQQPDGLIALGGDPQQALTVDRAVAPANNGAPEARRAVPARNATVSTKTEQPEQATASNVRKMKYGSMGITALTATSVVLVDGKRGQFAVSKDQALPDGSIVQSVDPRNHRITTNHGVIQLD